MAVRGVDFGLADCVQTGMFTDIEVIKRYLHEATYVFINGDFDRLSYLEIGIALSLGKTLYVITMNPNVTKEDLGISFDNATIEFLSPVLLRNESMKQKQQKTKQK